MFNDTREIDAKEESVNLNDLDDLFNKLSSDVTNFKAHINSLNEKRKMNLEEERELFDDKERLNRAKQEFESYIEIQNQEVAQKKLQLEEFFKLKRDGITRAEEELKINTDNSLKELELIKKELEIQRDKLKEDQEQFKSYKELELDRLHQEEEKIKSQRNQLEKYKEVTNKKIELETKNLEQKCARFKQIVSEFNSNFRPILEDKE